jgi:pyruvate dehydrogenase E1 component
MTKKLLVPDIGDFENVEVIELLVKEGQEIKQNDPVVTIESDKSSVEIPSTFSGKIDSILVKVGDKVSKGDLLLEITSSTQATQSLQDVPKKTENLIQEAENSLKKIKEKKIVIQNIKKEKPELIQVTNEGDIDPLETNEWLESLSEVIEKDGNQRAHYLIKELINKAYMEGANIPYTQNTPYINTIPVNEEKKSNGDQNIERRIRSLIRWNAAAMMLLQLMKMIELMKI